MKSNAALFLGVLVLAGSAAPDSAAAQGSARWDVDPLASMVWWQVNPHFGHLWATTCPNDDTWAAGEGRSTQYRAKSSRDVKVRQTNVKESDETIPLFPRDTVRTNCRRAIQGDVTFQDGASLRGAAGSVRVHADSLTIGSDMRDTFARKYVYKTSSFKDITFKVDSVAPGGGARGDTIQGTIFGEFTMRGQTQKILVPFRAWDEPTGRRVQGKWHMTASSLVNDYKVPKAYLAMGVASKLFEELHMGFDLVLKRSGSGDDGEPPNAGGR